MIIKFILNKKWNLQKLNIFHHCTLTFILNSLSWALTIFLGTKNSSDCLSSPSTKSKTKLNWISINECTPVTQLINMFKETDYYFFFFKFQTEQIMISIRQDSSNPRTQPRISKAKQHSWKSSIYIYAQFSIYHRCCQGWTGKGIALTWIFKFN